MSIGVMKSLLSLTLTALGISVLQLLLLVFQLQDKPKSLCLPSITVRKKMVKFPQARKLY